MKIIIDKIKLSTPRATLIQVNEYLAWIPKSQIQIFPTHVIVNDWFVDKIKWEEDVDDIEYVADVKTSRKYYEDLQDSIERYVLECKK